MDLPWDFVFFGFGFFLVFFVSLVFLALDLFWDFGFFLVLVFWFPWFFWFLWFGSQRRLRSNLAKRRGSFSDPKPIYIYIYIHSYIYTQTHIVVYLICLLMWLFVCLFDCEYGSVCSFVLVFWRLIYKPFIYLPTRLLVAARFTDTKSMYLSVCFFQSACDCMVEVELT